MEIGGKQAAAGYQKRLAGGSGACSFVFFLGPLVVGVFCIIDIVKYLKCSDEAFEQIYVIGKKEWF